MHVILRFCDLLLAYIQILLSDSVAFVMPLLSTFEMGYAPFINLFDWSLYKQNPDYCAGQRSGSLLLDAAGHAERGGQGRQDADEYLKNGLPVFLFHVARI